MDKNLLYETEIIINAPISHVWDALINPEKTPHYMFGCVPESNWNVGDPVIWRGMQDGVTYVIGHVVEFEPEKVLAYTTFDPNSKYEDIPANYLTGRWVLTEGQGGTKLEISQGNFSMVEDGEKRYKDAQMGWEMGLKGLKQLLEK